MNEKDYLKKLASLEKKANLIAKKLEIKFDAKRIFSFATLNFVDDPKIFKMIASENFVDLNSKKIVKTALGEIPQFKKKTTKHQIFLLGNRKLMKLTPKEAIDYLKSAYELLSLYKQYKSYRELIQSEYELIYAENISANLLHEIEPEGTEREESEYIAYRRGLPNDADYKKWSIALDKLNDEDIKLKDQINEELSNR